MFIRKMITLRPFALALALCAGLYLQPVSLLAETNGSYAHPGISGIDEGNPMGKSVAPSMPTSKTEGSTKKSAPSTRTEGSAKKGHGPGASPHGHKEGSKGKHYKHGMGYGGGEHHGKGYAHGKEGHGYSKGYAHGKKHHGGSKGKHDDHGKKYAHGGGHHGGSKGKHGYAKHGGHGGGHHKGHKQNPFKHILRYKDKLGLTADQIEQIQQKRFEHEKLTIQAGADHMIAHLELDKLVHSGSTDEAAMRAIGERIVAIKAKKIRAMIESKIWLLKHLTAEQRAKVAGVHSSH